MVNPQDQKSESIWLNLLVNVAIPSIILGKFSGEHQLGPIWGLIVALAFPIGYGLWDFVQRGKFNFFSALGIFSTLATGGMTLLKLPPEYIAIKEATIPALFGIAVVGSLFTPFPLVRTFLYSEKILQVNKVDQALAQYGNQKAFDNALIVASWLLAGSFFLSAVLNYGLAEYVLVSQPGTPEFNEELSKMMALSWPVITLPSLAVLCLALYYLLHRIKKLTHLPWEAIFNDGTTAAPHSKEV